MAASTVSEAGPVGAFGPGGAGAGAQATAIEMQAERSAEMRARRGMGAV